MFKRTWIENKPMIYSLPLDGKPCPLAPKQTTLKLSANLGVARALLVESFIASFAGKAGRQIVDVGPLKVLSGEPEHDFIGQAVKNVPVPDWLLVRLAHCIDARVFEFEGQPPFVGLVFDHHAFRQIARPCSDWIAAGFDLRGLYVSEAVPFNDTRIRPRLRLVGRVEKVMGPTLHLSDCRVGWEKGEAETVQIEADYEGFHRCCEALFAGKTKWIDRDLFALQSDARIGPRKLGELSRIESRLTLKPMRLLPGVEATILPHLHSKGKFFPAAHRAPQALYVFDSTFNKPAETNAKLGIVNNGPYSQRFFTPTKPRICVVCQRDRKGAVEQFLQKLFEGNVEPGRTSYFPNGLIKTYRLQGRDMRFFVADNGSATAYRKAAQQALAAVESESDRWHLAYVQVDSGTHDLVGEENPYLVVKSTFLAQQVPVQEFQAETMAKPGSSLDFVLSNIALASYAKLGGTPWQLKVDKAIAHELVVGLGSAEVSDSRLGARHRYVGITTLFTSEGRYLLGNVSNAVPFDDYSAAVLEMLVSAVERAKGEMNWQKGEEVRLIFHSFKPLKDAEAEAVKALASKLTDYTVDFAFLHVAHEHDSVLFDSDNPGARSFGKDVMKGEFAPARGTYLTLNKSHAILALTGAEQVKKPTDGLPYPVLLHLHRASTFTDIDYLTKQVFIFASHSWRTFDMARMPVTILYSQMIARQLGRLGRLPHFSIDSIHGRLNRLRWYL